MVDPFDVTKFEREQNDLEEYLLFCIVVAGKTATTQAIALERFLSYSDKQSPFDAIREMIANGTLLDNVKMSKLGQYTKIAKAFQELVEKDLDINNCSPEELEDIHGIGPKTSRFFVLHSRPNQEYAVLDTHILRYMREHLKIDAPKSTPNGKRYAQLEQQFLDFAKKTNIPVADLDLAIWEMYSRGNPFTFKSLREKEE